jgi:hypothetical protein
MADPEALGTDCEIDFPCPPSVHGSKKSV